LESKGKFKGNIVIGQSGGPTAVINATVAGVYTAAKEEGVEKVYGMVHGVEGFLKKDLIGLEEYLDTGLGIELLKRTPSAFLGSCRFKLPAAEAKPEIYEKIFSVMEEFNITAFFYIGGNDSMDTVKQLTDYAAANGKKQVFIGLPKTVDNDLPVTDHCPGFGSAAKYIATSFKEIIRDAQSNSPSKPTIILVETMGRHTGWLTAAAALAAGEDCEGADAIYLPEKVFDIEAFINHVEEVAKRKHTVVIAVSEGAKVADGRFVCELGGGSGNVDAFGHTQLSGCAHTLSDMIVERFGYKTRVIELSTLQRAASHIASLTDIEESYLAGCFGMKAAARGETGLMVILERVQNNPYLCRMNYYDVHQIANVEKTVPLEWIKEDGISMTDEFLEYARPLIMGELLPLFVHGLPSHLVRKK